MRCLIAILPIMFCVACGESYKDNQHAFDGVKFSASLKAEKNAPEAFSLRVKKAAKSVVGAREAGRYEATKYCVEKFGTSDIAWIMGPDSPDLELENGDFNLIGSCVIL